MFGSKKKVHKPVKYQANEGPVFVNVEEERDVANLRHHGTTLTGEVLRARRCKMDVRVDNSGDDRGPVGLVW